MRQFLSATFPDGSSFLPGVVRLEKAIAELDATPAVNVGLTG